MAVKDWSTTAADNDDADPQIQLQEGMAAGSVNDEIRDLMAVLKGDFANNLVTNGYQKLPNGMILQWGLSTNASTDYVVTLPVAHPTGTINAQVTVYGIGATTTVYYAYADILSPTGFVIRTRSIVNGGAVGAVGSISVLWFTIGV